MLNARKLPSRDSESSLTHVWIDRALDREVHRAVFLHHHLHVVVGAPVTAAVVVALRIADATTANGV